MVTTQITVNARHLKNITHLHDLPPHAKPTTALNKDQFIKKKTPKPFRFILAVKGSFTESRGHGTSTGN